MNEQTEMGEAPKVETEAIYAWALDDGDDLPTQRLTSRRITTLALAASLVVIAVAGGVALGVLAPAQEPFRPVVVTPVAVLDGTYRFDSNLVNNTIMGSPNPPPDGQPTSETNWRVFRSTCTPAGCTATETALDDTNHSIAATPLTTHQWRFTEGRWQMLPERSRETRQGCKVEQDKTVDGDETVLGASSLEPQPGGSLHGLSVVTAISSECGQEGAVYRSSFIATRVGDVPPGVPMADPPTVSVPPEPVAPVAGPVLDGTYRLDEDDRQVNTAFRWFAFRSICTVTGCVATEADLDRANHQEPTGGAGVFHFTNGHWIDNGRTALISCGPNPGAGGTQQTVTLTRDLALQPDGTLRGVFTITYKSNECGSQGLVVTTSLVGTQTGPVPPNVVLADPALFV